MRGKPTVAVACIALAAALLVAALPAPAQVRRGGILRYAHYAEPPTLDIHWTTAAIVGDITRFIYEGLFTLNSKSEPVPMLVQTWRVSPDRQQYTFELRRGVQFHHGRELTADDVVASLQRWGRVASRGRELFRQVTALTATDRYTVQLRLAEPNALVLPTLAFPGQWAAIYPKEVVDEYGTNVVRRFIGTGPYRLAEHVPDRHIRLERWDRYQPRAEPADGLGGARPANFDAALIMPVPDPAVRIAGVQRGEYDFAHAVPPDEYERLRQDPRVVPFVEPSASWLLGQFNKRQGIMTNKTLRHAVLAALDLEKIMAGAFGPRALWRLDPSLMPKETAFWTDVGKEYYNQKNPQRARQLIAEAGYRGEPIRWLTSPERPTYFDATQIARAQLEAVGLRVELVTTDWATLLTRRTRPELWDIFTTGMLAPLTDPTLILAILPTWPGWYESREVAGLLRLLARHVDPKVRYDFWKRAQKQFYEDAAAIKFGDFFVLHLHRRELKGVVGAPIIDLGTAYLER
ncbi:MAG: ABC transporter substrate-binding protein [Armatimonadota bacterium]|nr:ABC transporter substrate-binding protein [Armatimonadota bacterium]